MTIKAVDMRVLMEIEEKFRGGDGQQAIVVVEMRENGYIGDGYTWRWRRRQRLRHETIDRGDKGGEEQ